MPGKHRYKLLIVPFMFIACFASAGLNERLVKIVYFVPADREPHEGYAERLGYVFKKLQSFYREEMKRTGYVDAAGEGKTFRLQTDFSGDVIVHIVDHSPDGNYPNPDRTVDLYRSNLGLWTGKDMADHFPSDFEDKTVLIIVADITEVQDDHLVHYGTNGGMGSSGPGETGIVYLTDQIMGIDENHRFDYPPRQFHALGKNDAEQIAILKDARCTNICDWSRPYNRNAPSSWNPGECPDPGNSMVWEYSTVVIGVIAHELGHALALPHCIRMTESVDPGVYADYNVMGNGFRAIFISLFPEGTFSESEQYSRMTGDVVGFGSGAILNPKNLVALNRNQFMNSGVALPDLVEPGVKILRADYNESAKYVEVEVNAKETEGENASGLSHISYLLDWNVHKAVEIPEADAFNTYESKDILNLTPGEYNNTGYVGNVFNKGLHTLTVASMDKCGNPAAFKDSVYHFSIGEYRINDWLIWSEYFDAETIVGGGAAVKDQLTHDYLSQKDSEITAWEGHGTGAHSWRRFHTGDYVNITDKMPYYFINPPDWSYHRVCYGAARLISNRERELNIRFGYNDFIGVLLNGEEIFLDQDYSSGHNGFDTSQFQTVPVTIRQGENHLLVKTINLMHDGGFHVFFEETNGDPVELTMWPPEDQEILAIRNSAQPALTGNVWVFYN